MTDAVAVFLAQLVGGVVLAVCIIGGVAACHHHIAYWAAFLISGCVIFGGFLFLDGDWIE